MCPEVVGFPKWILAWVEAPTVGVKFVAKDKIPLFVVI